MKGPYDDIIHLPHHVSEKHPRMSAVNRAAQFQPFRALTGYEDAVQETARLTGQKIELTEDEKMLLDMKLQQLADLLPEHPQVTLTYFLPDQKKAGGTYVTTTGEIRKIDEIEHIIIMKDRQRIPITDILDVQF